MNRLRILIVAAAMLLTVLLAGCAPVNDAQYQMVFGKSADELIPTVGNAAYSNRPLFEEETEEDPAATETSEETEEVEEDNYVDPTAGLDCSE